MTSALLPTPTPGGRKPLRLGVRTGGDRPPEQVSPPASSRNGSHAPPVPDFGPLAISLRREVLRFYYDEGKRLLTPGELTTLATNADLVESRTATLEHGLALAGIPSLRDLDVADLGCGFGALSVKFAAAGARVTSLDPNHSRMRVGKAVARRHGLDVLWRRARMQDQWSGSESFDVAVMNNSLCYLLETEDRLAALRHTRQALRPGGVLVIRNPNRVHHRDQFSGLPLVGLLPPRLADSAARLLGRERSKVRLLTTRAARRELRKAGFVDVRAVRRPGELRLRAAVAGYQHLVARAPRAGAGQ
jgi:2-polyprenyl-3-methyl-5-hydroxy-6-metoxy-1,4-benzoquinol methylase